MKRFVTIFLFVVSVHLAWDASTSSEVTGYKLYYGTATGIYSTTLNVGNVTNYTVSNVDETQPIFFAAKAYDANGNESAYSTELACSVISGKIVGSGTMSVEQSDWAGAKSGSAVVVERNTSKHATVVLTPATNYTMTALKVDSAWTSLESTIQFTNVAANHSIEAIFQKGKTLEGMEWVK